MPGGSLMYFYVNELDKAGHRHGCQSPQWEHQLEELDATVKRLSATLPAGTTILLTADHGMLDVPESQRIDYSADPALVAGVRHTAGEPRMVHLYLEERKATPAACGCSRPGGRVSATGSGPSPGRKPSPRGSSVTVRAEVAPRIGDVMIAAREPLAFYDTRRVRPTALEVVGQHGSLTKAEREVPLLCFQADGKRAPRA